MNYKETLLFIGKCLALSKEDKNLKVIREQLSNGRVDWDRVVQMSTEHYVFPTLYVNLRNMDLLGFLPTGLVEFMKDVHTQNSDRNREIIQQAKELDLLLKKNGIAPVFMNGSGMLLDGLYQDFGERMICDIDLLVDSDKIKYVLEIMARNGYQTNPSKNKRMLKKGSLRVVHSEKIAAVELRTRVIRNRKNYMLDEFLPEVRTIKDGYHVMSYSQQMFLVVMTAYHNKHGYKCFATPLRSVYDVLLLSNKTAYFDIFTKTPEFFEKINAFLAMSNYVTDSRTIIYISSGKSAQFLGKIDKLAQNPKVYQRKIQFKLFMAQIKRRLIFNVLSRPYRGQFSYTGSH